MRPRVRLRVGQGSARAELTRGQKVLWAGEAPFATPEELEQAVCQLAAREPLPARPTALRVTLEPPLAQLRTLRGLPPVRTAQLKAMVVTQAGRFFRRNGKPLVTDACWPDRKARREGTALAAAAEEPWVEAVIRGARVAGLGLEAVQPVGLPPGASLVLLTPAERRRRREQAFLSLRRLAVAAGLAWLIAGSVFLVRLERERVAVEREIARLEQPARAVASARRALGEAAKMVETLQGAASERSRLPGRAIALAAAVPDSAFLTSLALNAERQGEIAVVARRPQEVLAALEAARAAESPRLAGSVVREASAGGEWERFVVVFDPAVTR